MCATELRDIIFAPSLSESPCSQVNDAILHTKQVRVGIELACADWDAFFAPRYRNHGAKAAGGFAVESVLTELGFVVIAAELVRLAPHRLDGFFGKPLNLKAIIDVPSSIAPDKPLLRFNHEAQIKPVPVHEALSIPQVGMVIMSR